MSASNQKTRRSAAQWQQIFKQFEFSGLSQQAFCEHQGIALSTFCKWRQQLFGESISPAPSLDRNEALFTPLSIEDCVPAQANTASWDIELQLGGGCILRIRSNAC